MGVWMGSLGALVEIACPSTQSRSGGVQYASAETVDGGRVAQAVRTLRSWSLDVSVATPSELGTLEQMADRVRHEPGIFVPVDAPMSNVATPKDTSVRFAPRRGWMPYGPRVMPDGTWVGAAQISDPATRTGSALMQATMTPVIPGKPVTVSAWLVGGQIRVALQNAANREVRAFFTPADQSTVVPVRHVVTIPADQVTVDVAGLWVTVEGDSTYAGGLAVTWTDQVMPWSAGRGCTSAILSAPDKWDTLAAFRDVRPGTGQFDAVSGWVVQEVGAP